MKFGEEGRGASTAGKKKGKRLEKKDETGMVAGHRGVQKTSDKQDSKKASGGKGRA